MIFLHVQVVFPPGSRQAATIHPNDSHTEQKTPITAES
jgi:hypothetical protein